MLLILFFDFIAELWRSNKFFGQQAFKFLVFFFEFTLNSDTILAVN